MSYHREQALATLPDGSEHRATIGGMACQLRYLLAQTEWRLVEESNEEEAVVVSSGQALRPVMRRATVGVKAAPPANARDRSSRVRYLASMQ